MNNFKNLKIAITDETHLKAVCDVLESVGYKKTGWIGYSKVIFITTNTKGQMTDHAISLMNCFNSIDLTTLSDLLKMRDDMVKANEKSR